MRKICLVIALCLISSNFIWSQYSVGGSTFTNLGAAVAAVPTTGVQTTIDVTSNCVETAPVTIAANKNILLKSNGGSYTIKVGVALTSYLININSGGTLTMQDIIIDGGAIWSDEALTVHADTTRTNSGIVTKFPLLCNSGTLAMNSGAVIQNNQNIDPTGNNCAGAILNMGGGTTTMNSGSMIKLTSVENIVNDTNGAGAIYNRDGNSMVYMNGDAKIAGCLANIISNPAGGVFNLLGGQQVMNDNSEIYGCYTKSGGGGGGVTQRQNTFKMNDNASIHHCMSKGAGGVLGYTNATIEMNDNSTIHENESSIYAGGLRLYSNSMSGGLSSILKMNDNSSIYNNEARTFAGGVYNYGGWIYMNDNASIISNKSGTFAGGVYVSGVVAAVAELNITGSGCKISNNIATTDYGGVYSASYTVINMSDGEVKNNTAINYGGIYSEGTNCIVNISGGKVSENTATSKGGGIGLGNAAVLNFTGGELSGNIASEKAGGLYILTDATNYPVANVVAGALIKDNVSPVGDAVYMCADKAGGPASIFNLDGETSVIGDIFLEKDTLNGAGGDFYKNKYVTLVSEPTQHYSLVTDPEKDSQYGRIVVVPGTTTVDATTYSITDAMPYTGNYSHNVRLVVKGIQGEFSYMKLMLGGTATIDSLTITPDNKWPESDPEDPDKPIWKDEYDKANIDSWSCGCDMTLNMYIAPDPYMDRTVNLNYLGALKKGYLVDPNGEVIADTYTLAKNDSVFTLHFSMLEDSITSEREGQKGAVELEIVGGKKDTSLWFNLYRHPSYDDILVKPYFDANGRIDLGLTGGTPNLMRSINGGPWRNAYEPLTASEKMSVVDGVYIWLREPYGCWEEKFVFITYVDPEIQRYIDIPNVQGVTTTPNAGKHYVEGHGTFSFTASFQGGTPLKVMATGYYSGIEKELTGLNMENGTYKYSLYQVVEPWAITFGPELASGTVVGNGELNSFSVWASGGVLHITSNSEAIAYIYNISGSLYKSLNILPGNTTEKLSQGIYIVAVGDKRYKIVIQ